MRISGGAPFCSAKAFATPSRVALSISLITTRGRPSSARQKRSKAAASLAGLASSRQTRSGSSSRPGVPGSRPTAPIT